MPEAGNKIVGHGDVPDDASRPRGSRPAVDRARRDADARGDAHACHDCGAAMSRDETLPAPFDSICERCLSIRAEVKRRIEESVQSVEDAAETGWYLKPIRPSWAKWRRSA